MKFTTMIKDVDNLTIGFKRLQIKI